MLPFIKDGSICVILYFIAAAYFKYSRLLRGFSPCNFLPNYIIRIADELLRAIGYSIGKISTYLF